MSKNVTVGLFVTLKAKPGKETEVEQFLKSALPLANQEEATIAAALMAKWEELLSEPPKIEQIDVLAAKLNS